MSIQNFLLVKTNQHSRFLSLEMLYEVEINVSFKYGLNFIPKVVFSEWAKWKESTGRWAAILIYGLIEKLFYFKNNLVSRSHSKFVDLKEFYSTVLKILFWKFFLLNISFGFMVIWILFHTSYVLEYFNHTFHFSRYSHVYLEFYALSCWVQYFQPLMEQLRITL